MMMNIKKKRCKEKKDKNTTTSKGNTKDEEETILEMLRMGYDTRTICRKTKLARIDVNNIQKNLIKKGIITKEQIDIAQEKYKEQTEQKILAGLKRRR